MAKESLAEIPEFCIVGEASSGEETIEHIQATQPDILVTGLLMKGMDGIQVTKQVRKLLPNVRVIIWSLRTEYTYILAALESGAKGYVIKDAGIDALITAIREINLEGFYLSPPLSKQKLDEFRAKLENVRDAKKRGTHITVRPKRVVNIPRRQQKHHLDTASFYDRGESY